MLGKLTWAAIPLNEPIPLVTSIIVILIIASILTWVTIKKHWSYLWREWITSVDHKRIGIMYAILGLVQFDNVPGDLIHSVFRTRSESHLA
mgnify:CR=1 FL=1|jgi:cytochrome o ubiquinol oxidase subunit 1